MQFTIKILQNEFEVTERLLPSAVKLPAQITVLFQRIEENVHITFSEITSIPAKYRRM